MRKFAAVLLALVFAGSVGGVGCFAAAANTAPATMTCCTQDCPPHSSPMQSCATPTCAPSVEVAPSNHGVPHPRASFAWAATTTAMTALQSFLSFAAAPRFASPLSFDSSLAFDRLCSRQI